MKRRDFLKMAGLATVMAGVPAQVWSYLSGLSEDEVEKKVKELLSQMSLQEKIEQMHGVLGVEHFARRALDPTYADSWDTKENKRLGIPKFRSLDGPRGVGTGRPTCFPVGMCRGATWDVALEERVGEVAGYEARTVGVNLLLTPCINLLRHPSWGRAQETYGEDPVLLGRLGSAHVIGVQKHVMACPKHFAANSIEESRFFVNVKMEERTLREIYLPHFKMCVEAGAASVMSAYNDLNGYLCAHNRHLLREILKGEWKFDGFVVSDWVNAVEDAVAAANAGLDLEMPQGTHFGRKLLKAVQTGQVKMEVIDEAVSRILRQKLRFIKPGDYTAGYDRKKIASAEHTTVALEVARKGIVLLKNEQNLLPLDRNQLKTLAVVGKMAKRANLGDLGSSAVRPKYAVSPLAGFRNKAKGVNIIYAAGGSAAVQAAKQADAVVVVVGCDFHDEGEGGAHALGIGGDRENLNLSPRDEKLIQEVAKVNPKCVVVLEAGAAITMQSWKDKVAAILMAWYPGMEGGNAIAEIIFGEVNPSGKLPHVFPKSADQLPPFDNKSKEVEYGYYHGYRWFDKKKLEPEFPFGFGLSYTQYRYENLKLSASEVKKNSELVVRVEVSNIGERAGEEIVQLYVGYPKSRVDRPVKELKAFTRVALQPGETKTVSLPLKIADLAFFNQETNAWEIEETEYTVLVGPNSKNEELLAASFRVGGE